MRKGDETWTWFNIYIVIQTLHHTLFYIHWQLIQCWNAKWSPNTALPAAALDSATPYHFLNLSQSQCLPYCINCPLHIHFHPSLTGHVSVLDVSFFIIFAINIQYQDASTHLMVGCSYDDNGMVQHIVYIVHFTSTSTPHLLVTCLS